MFYELGVRHSLSKRTIIVTQNPEDIPSDLRGYWSIGYGTKPAQVTRFAENTRRIIGEIEADPEKSDSPVSDYLERKGKLSPGLVRREPEDWLALQTTSNALEILLQQREGLETMYALLVEEHSALSRLTLLAGTHTGDFHYVWLSAKDDWSRLYESALQTYRKNNTRFPRDVADMIFQFLADARVAFDSFTRTQPRPYFAPSDDQIDAASYINNQLQINLNMIANVIHQKLYRTAGGSDSWHACV